MRIALIVVPLAVLSALILIAAVFLSGSRGGAIAIAMSGLLIYGPKLIEKKH